MDKFKLTAIPSAQGKTTYQVKNHEGEIIYTSAPTAREYAAIAGDGNQARHRWGRVDLIGNGESKLSWEAGRYEWVAVKEEVFDLVTPNQTVPIRLYSFEHRGRKVETAWHHEQGARARAVKLLKHRYGMMNVAAKSLTLTGSKGWID